MKKLLIFLLCISILSVSAFAVEMSDYEVVNEDGTSYIDMDSYNCALAAEMIAEAGLDLDASSYWITDWLGNTTYDYAAFEADYNAAMSVKASAESPTESEVVDESVADDFSSDTGYPVGSVIDEAGNVWSPEGELLSPGTTPAAPAGTYDQTETDLLVPEGEAVVAEEEVSEPVYVVNDLRNSDSTNVGISTFGMRSSFVPLFTNQIPISIDIGGAIYNGCGYKLNTELAPGGGERESSCFVTGFIPLGVGETEEFIIRVTSSFYSICFYDANFQVLEFQYYSKYGTSGDSLYMVPYSGDASFFRVTFVSTADPSSSIITINEEITYDFVNTGLKALVISIFGEYTPIYTTGSVTETVGDVTTTTLYDVVADGAAGIDFEWCAGVLLFGILLYCLMKLLGGILK